MHGADAQAEEEGALNLNFTAGDVAANVGGRMLRVRELLRVVRPSVTGQLQELADEFLENVGGRVASVCILDL